MRDDSFPHFESKQVKCFGVFVFVFILGRVGIFPFLLIFLIRFSTVIKNLSKIFRLSFQKEEFLFVLFY